MKTQMLGPVGLTAIAIALGACVQQPTGLKPAGGDKTTYHEDPTQGPAQAPGAYNGGVGNTFDHFADLGVLGGRDPFDILAQRQEEGPAEVRTRLHSCQKIQYETLANILVSLGVDMTKKGSTPPSAAELYMGGAGALGVANYDARVGETITWSAAGAAKLFDIFTQAAPEIIANIGSSDQCKVNGMAAQMFDAQNNCNADALTCIMGRPATPEQVDVCTHLVSAASSVDTGKNIAVATVLAATHSCE
jgi:hypothetical protein